MSLLLNMLSRLVITFLPRHKRLLISWLQSQSAVILEPQEIKSHTVSPSIFHKTMGPDVMILVFWMLSFKPTFSLSSFTFFKRLFSSHSLGICMFMKGFEQRKLQNGTEVKVGQSPGCRPWLKSQRPVTVSIIIPEVPVNMVVECARRFGFCKTAQECDLG